MSTNPEELIIGLNGVVRVSRKKRWTAARGHHYVEVWRGPIVKVEEYYESLQNAQGIDALDFDDAQGKPVGTLTVTRADDDGTGQGSNEELNTQWELVGQDLYKDIRAHETFNQDADQVNLELCREHVERAIAAELPEGIAGEPFETYTKLLRRGTNQFLRSVAVLRKTIIVGPDNVIVPTWDGVDRAWKLDNEAGSPEPPNALIGDIVSLPEGNNLKKQWLKRAPNRTQISELDWRISQEWWYAARWSYALYVGDDEDGNP